MAQPEPMTFDAIEDLARGYQLSRLILTAVELDLFTAIGDETPAAVEVARRLGTDPRGTEILLNALVGPGLLAKTSGRFSCTDLSRQYLREGSPQDSRAPFLHHNDLWKTWSKLTETVRTGKAPTARAAKPGLPRAFIGAMHRFALDQAPAFIDALPLDGAQRVVDLGGGSAAYAITFAKRLPNADVAVFDSAPVIELAKEYIAQAGLEGRIRTLVGDILTDDFGSGYDLVWLSHVVHGWGPDDIRKGFRRIRESLAPKGRLILREFILDEDKTSPAFGTVFAINMLVNTERGNAYSLAEYRDWLAEAGFSTVRPITVEGAGNASMLEAVAP